MFNYKYFIIKITVVVLGSVAHCLLVPQCTGQELTNCVEFCEKTSQEYLKVTCEKVFATRVLCSSELSSGTKLCNKEVETACERIFFTATQGTCDCSGKSAPRCEASI